MTNQNVELARSLARYLREQAAKERDAVIVPSTAEEYAAMLDRLAEGAEISRQQTTQQRMAQEVVA